jgi:hypothetical protein
MHKIGGNTNSAPNITVGAEMTLEGKRAELASLMEMKRSTEALVNHLESMQVQFRDMNEAMTGSSQGSEGEGIPGQAIAPSKALEVCTCAQLCRTS